MNALLEELGQADTLLTDAGYYTDDNVASCERFGIEPYIPSNREKHNQPPTVGVIDSATLPEDAETIDKVRSKLKIVDGRKVYVQRKRTVEPEFGVLKHVLDFCQFFLRG